jgi:hypothetical protein
MQEHSALVRRSSQSLYLFYYGKAIGWLFLSDLSCQNRTHLIAAYT